MRYFWLSVVGLLTLFGAGSWWVLDTVNHTTGKSSDAVVLTIAKGAGVRDISASLAQQKLIKSPQAWTLYVVLTGARSSMKAGSYQLDHGMTGREIVHTLSTVEPLKDNEVIVKVADGLTNKEIADLLERKGVIDATTFLQAASTHDSRTVVKKNYAFLVDKPTSTDLQGYLFPDTYRFFKQSSAGAVIQKFLDNFDTRVSAATRQAAQQSGHTLYQELTMASILEKELKSDNDRALGADVFWKRIKLGMALQSNATILYAMGKSEDNLSLADTKFDSAYNTYLHPGLPPGPINNPSFKSLRAAVYPQANPYYYFLSSPTTGTTYFAKTLEEHNQNKAKYLR